MLFQVVGIKFDACRTVRHGVGNCWSAVLERGAGGQTEYLRVLMRSLRQKLKADPTRPAMPINEPGVGYRLVGG